MIAHSLIDFRKCRLGYKLIVDQMLPLELQVHLDDLCDGHALSERHLYYLAVDFDSF